jgi:hypothetical protein
MLSAMSLGADHRAGHDAGDLLAGAGQAEHRTGQDAFARGALRQRASGLVGLRVVEHDERGTHRAAVGPLVLHAANATGDAGDLDDRTAGLAAGHRRQHDLAGGPADVRPLALVELAVAAIGDAVERLDRVDDLGKVGEQQSLPSSSILIDSSMSIACPSSEPIRQTKSRCPYSTAQMQAHSQIVVLPEPRGIAIANRPPRSTACSILAITFKWSGDHGRWNVSGKYESQKKRKSDAPAPCVPD